MDISELNITKFRHLNDINIHLGSRLTAIAGQNGTGKSTVLGLLGHVCREKTGFKTFDNKRFETEYSEIFKFSFPEYDKPKEHIYDVSFTDGNTVSVVSYSRKERNKKEGLRLRVGHSSKMGGKIDFPVIFLGLKRLYPLAQERKIQSSVHQLSDDEVAYFQKHHNSILLMQERISTEEVKSNNKHFVAAKSESYDAIGNSAGQDNVGQIITSIISFQRLKKQLGDKYSGGVLLIDELDATLYPAAQSKIIEFLFKVSSRLGLQVIFTTHSIEILEILLTSKYRHQSEICYFHKAEGPVKKIEKSELPVIVADLKAEVLIQKTKETKIEIYLEDKEAEQFLKVILNPEHKKKIKIINATFGAEELLNLGNKRIPAFNKSIIVLDGDKNSSLTKPRPSNIIILPGSDSPEKVMFTFLKSLNETDSFWGGVGGYTKQICFRDLTEIGNREVMKNWWKNQIQFWGINGRTLIKHWMAENPKDTLDFNKNFNNKIQNAFSKMYK